MTNKPKDNDNFQLSVTEKLELKEGLLRIFTKGVDGLDSSPAIGAYQGAATNRLAAVEAAKALILLSKN